MNRAVTAAILVGLCSFARAQVGVPRNGPPGGSIFHISFETSLAHLAAGRPDVQRELRLTPTQVARIEKIVKSRERDELHGDPRTWDLVSPVLNAGQRTRLKALSIQALGIYAALVPELSHDIGLTPVQKRRIASVKRVYLLAQDKGLAESMMGKNVPAPEREERSRVQLQALNGGIENVLTASQRRFLKAPPGRAFAFNPPIKRNGMVVWMPAFGMR